MRFVTTTNDDDDAGKWEDLLSLKMEFSARRAYEMCLNLGGIIVAQIFYSHNTIVINTKRTTSAGPPYACPACRRNSESESSLALPGRRAMVLCTSSRGDLNSSHVGGVISLT